MNLMIEMLKAILLGIVQGITEWLPISSTGHMILVNELMPLTVLADAAANKEFVDMFMVVIQFPDGLLTYRGYRLQSGHGSLDVNHLRRGVSGD